MEPDLFPCRRQLAELTTHIVRAGSTSRMKTLMAPTGAGLVRLQGVVLPQTAKPGAWLLQRRPARLFTSLSFVSSAHRRPNGLPEPPVARILASVSAGRKRPDTRRAQ